LDFEQIKALKDTISFGDLAVINITVNNLNGRYVYLESSIGTFGMVKCSKDTTVLVSLISQTTFWASDPKTGGNVGKSLEVFVSDKYPEKTKLLNQKPWHIKTTLRVWNVGEIDTIKWVNLYWIHGDSTIILDSATAAAVHYTDKYYFNMDHSLNVKRGDTVTVGSAGWMLLNDSCLALSGQAYNPSNLTQPSNKYIIEKLSNDTLRVLRYDVYISPSGNKAYTYRYRTIFVH